MLTADQNFCIREEKFLSIAKTLHKELTGGSANQRCFKGIVEDFKNI